MANTNPMKCAECKEWHPDVRAESVLRLFKLEAKLGLHDLDEIDEAKSIANQAREVPIDQEMVDSYAIRMQAGDSFPAGVAIRDGKKLILFGGNHRFRAAKEAGRSTMLLYVIETEDSMTIDLLPKRLNSIEGKRQEKSELTRAVLRMLGAEKATERLVAKGAPANMGATVLYQLSQIENDNSMAHAARIASAAKLTGDITRQLVDDVRAKRTEAEQGNVLNNWQKKLSVSNGEHAATVVKRSVKSEFFRAFTCFERVLQNKRTLDQFQITRVSDKEDIKERWKKLRKQADAIFARS